MRNKSIVSQLVWGLLAGALAALMVWIALGAINKTYAKEPLDNCHNECTLSIPWCYRWYGFTCWGWTTKCLEHKLVCELPDPTPSPLINPSPSPVTPIEPSPISLSNPPSSCRESCDKHVEPPVCSKTLPNKPSFTFVPVYPNGLTMNWFENDENTTNWAISYGYSQENLDMGVPFLPIGARSYTIQGVDLNRHVWMQLHRFNTGECRVSSDVVDP